MRRSIRSILSAALIFLIISVALVPSSLMKDSLSADPLLEEEREAGVHTKAPMDGNSTSPGNFTEFFSYNEMRQHLTDLQTKYPELVKVELLGATYEGRNVLGVKISDNVQTTDDNGYQEEPDVLYTGLHHANEWISFAFVMYYIDWLIDNYVDPQAENHSQARWLINNRELWFIPMLNPDGYIYNGDGDFANKQNWRKNREPNYLPVVGTPLPENGWGTDLNRNYHWLWGEEISNEPASGMGSSFNPYSSLYRGPRDNNDDDGDSTLGVDLGDPLLPRVDLDKVDEDPVDGIDNDNDGLVDEDPDGGFTTAETQIVKKLVEDNDFVFALNYHTYSELVIYPWGTTSEACPHEWLFQRVGGVLANLTGYTLVNGWDFYRTTGDSDDWMYGVHGIYAMTIELSRSELGGHNTPPDQIVPISELNVPAALHVANIADNPESNFLHIHHEEFEDTYDFKGPYELVVDVTDPENTGGLKIDFNYNEEIYLHYSVNGGGYRKMQMLENLDGTFSAFIPGQERGTDIKYYIEANDKRDINITEPRFAPYDIFDFKVLNPNEPTILMRVALVISMLFFFAVTWGSFIYCIVLAIKAEKTKKVEA